MAQQLQEGAFHKDNVNYLNRTLEGLQPPLVGAADVAPHFGFVPIGSAGVDAIALSQPTAGSPPAVAAGEDGEVVIFFDAGGHAHVVTTAANGINGNKHTITFNGTVGSFAELVAYNGVWYVLISNGVALA